LLHKFWELIENKSLLRNCSIFDEFNESATFQEVAFDAWRRSATTRVGSWRVMRA